MSYKVTSIVRAYRLPSTMKRRPEAKAVLLALADRCDDGGNGAWPSIDTIAKEVETGRRTVERCLKSLQNAGLIHEEMPPTHHRPRMWWLDLSALSKRPDTSTQTRLNESDTPPVTHLDLDRQLDHHASDTSDQAPDTSNRTPDTPNRTSDPAPLSHDPVLRSGPLNGHLNIRAAAQRPRFSLSAKERRQNQPQLERIVAEVLDGALPSENAADIETKIIRMTKYQGVMYDRFTLDAAIGAARARQQRRTTASEREAVSA